MIKQKLRKNRSQLQYSTGVSLILFLVLVIQAITHAQAKTMTIAIPPGAETYPDELKQNLGKILFNKLEQGYKPRTHHFREDGSPKYTNRLMLESSPYLLQHAHNPVNWYSWGEEAFAAAKRLNRPILLSVGYSTCHWCHVMERESFEDEEIARVLNEKYIAIKVDREERPDVDSIYMTVVQMLTGRGGWPMNVWLTPDRIPFYGGTYFPARDGDRGVKHGFLTLLQVIRQNYDSHPEEVASYSQQISDALKQQMGAVEASGSLPGNEIFESAATLYRENFDPFHGGLNTAPKFPSTLPVRFLLRHHRRSGDEEFLKMAAITLEKMAAGGINDQLGGGFHRYSVDGEWLVPHFEKMLYDNALLAVAYLEGYQATGREDFADVTRSILDYVSREMTATEGGFYSATDADSKNPQDHYEEGWFFTWTPAELDALLNEQQARVVKAFYGVTENGNFEGRNIFHRTQSAAETATQLEISLEDFQQHLTEAHKVLYQHRATRPEPLLDNKILVSWNGLMISAFATAGSVLNDSKYLNQATRAANFILTHMRKDGRLFRSYNVKQARHNAYLDDYACLIAALLDLNEATAETRWLEEAIALQKVLDEHYADDDNGGYFLTSDDHEVLLVREKPSYDGAEPSGNSIALLNLLRLYEFTTDYDYRAKAEHLLKSFSERLSQNPADKSVMMLGLDYYLDAAKEVVIVTPKSRDEAEPFLAALRKTFLPSKVLIVANEGDDLERQTKLIPFLEGKKARAGKATAYVCEAGMCQLPTDDVAVFLQQLAKP